MVIAYQKPTSAEINAVKSGTAQFALLAGDHALLLCYRLGDQRWSDAPWQAMRQQRAGRQPGVAHAGPGQTLQVVIVLVDADTGIARAIRGTTWPEPFVTAVAAAIDRQLAATGPDRGQQEIDAWYQRYPDTADAVRDANITTTGGEVTTRATTAAAAEGQPAGPAQPQELVTKLFGAHPTG
jgi:hypothetical protein